MSGNSEEFTIYVLLVAFFLILRTMRGRMVFAGRSAGDMAHTRSREEESWTIRQTHQIRTSGACVGERMTPS